MSPAADPAPGGLLGFHASTVRLDSGAVVAVLAGVAVVAVLVLGWSWGSWRRRPAVGRSATALVATVAVLAAAAAGANLLGGFFPTLGSLLGSSPNPGEGTVADIGPDGAGLAAALPLLAARSAAGHGSTVHLLLHGARSGITRDADVYLPAGYTDPGDADLRYPVVEWLPGFPGEPREVASLFGVPDLIDAAIAGHRMPPAVVVIPDINGEPRFGHDEECVDAEHGVADDTYLSTDVADWVRSALRVRTDRDAWALSGWSSGGYCAMNLALRHPDLYGVAVSQSGYDRTPSDVVTGNLLGGRPDLADANDVVVALHSHPAPLAVLATAGDDESDELAALDRIAAAASPPVTVEEMRFPGGGHNQNAVRAQLPSIVDWLGRHLPGPHGTDVPPPPGTEIVPAAPVPARVLPVVGR